MKTKDIIWIFGVSAVGKEAFCKYVLGDPSQKLLARLDLTSKKIAVCDISVKSTAKFTDDPIIKDRLGMPNQVQQLLEDHDAVLVKWQYTDMPTGIFKQVSEISPKYRTRIISLSATQDLVAERLLKKEWWQREHPQDDPAKNVDWETKMVQSELFKLAKKYPITTVKSKPGYNFE